MSIIEGAKGVVELARAYDKMDLYQKAVELMTQVSELAEENFRVKTDLASLKRQVEIDQSLVFRENGYYQKKGESAGELVGPFCSRCKDTKQILVRMHATNRFLHGSQFSERFCACPECGKANGQSGGPVNPEDRPGTVKMNRLA